MTSKLNWETIFDLYTTTETWLTAWFTTDRGIWKVGDDMEMSILEAKEFCEKETLEWEQVFFHRSWRGKQR